MHITYCRIYFWTFVIYTVNNLFFVPLELIEGNWKVLIPMTTNGMAFLLVIFRHRYAATAVCFLATLLIVSGILHWVSVYFAGSVSDLEKTIEKTIMFVIGVFFFVSSLKCTVTAKKLTSN